MQAIQNNSVQQKIKKMMKYKKMAKQGQSQTQTRKRVASQNFLEDIHTRRQNQQDEKSIRTQWGKRNTNPQNYRQTQKSEATTSQTSAQNSRIQVEKIVNTIFNHSPKLTQYLEQYNMKKQDALYQLMSNQLFILSLSSKLSKLQNQANDNSNGTSGLNGMVQNQIILKLTKINRKKKQSLSCFDIQNRIKSLISRRLDSLNKY